MDASSSVEEIQMDMMSSASDPTPAKMGYSKMVQEFKNSISRR